MIGIIEFFLKNKILVVFFLRFILQYAADNDGVVVSNDNFRDLQHEKDFQFIINNRLKFYFSSIKFHFIFL
jgi:hypothetical protein